jgi:hypothetical protein
MIKIIITDNNQVAIEKDGVSIVFDPETATEINYGLTVAMAEAGRRIKKEDFKTSLVLSIETAETNQEEDDLGL